MNTPAQVRIIPRLDIKGHNVVKGIHLEGLRIVGQPGTLALQYYRDGADEIVYMDIVASLYGRNNILAIVERAARDVFIPLTVGGGIRTIEDIRQLLRTGADKVAINTAAVKDPDFIRRAARTFGSQCIVVSIEAKRRAPGSWEALTDNGREKTGLDVLDWAKRAVALGAGELLVTSVDQEGTGQGYDLELSSKIAPSVPVPVILCGGAASPQHVRDGATIGRADALAMAGMLHYKRSDVVAIKSCLRESSVGVRLEPLAP